MASYRDSSAYDFSLFEDDYSRNGTSASSQNKRASTKITPSESNVKNSATKKNANYRKQTASSSREYGNAVRKTSVEPEKQQGAVFDLDAYQHTVERNSVSAEVSSSFKKMLLYGALCLGLIFTLLCMDAQCDKVTSDIADVKAKIDIADGEAVRLNAELSSRISTDRVERYAENVLGMVKAEVYQITYLDLSDGDKVTVSGDKTPKEKSSFSGKVKEFFAYIF